MHETILIVDFGSQYTQLIARRVREQNVYCEIHTYNSLPRKLENVKGVILSGSPSSVKDTNAPRINLKQFQGKVPLLGLCYGAQLIAHNSGGKVVPSHTREFGRANLKHVDNGIKLLKNVTSGSQVWMSHGDTIAEVPENFSVITSTTDVKIAGYKIKDEQTYGIQFHPEVAHTLEGKKLLHNFLFEICGCRGDWTPAYFIDETVKALKNQLKNDKVIMGLSGGVDSTVAAMLLHEAIEDNLHCIFVNNGLLRKNEYKKVLENYKSLGLNVHGVDESERFLSALKGVSEPEQKRKIIGHLFIDIFDESAIKIGNVEWLAQGTIYPDVIESISVKGPSAKIKSHHNVGGLPEKMNLKIVEPLRNLFKDEVRSVGISLGIPPEILNRHPFPGPGLAIRILGEVTPEKVDIVQQADSIFINALIEENFYDQVWQAGAILLPVFSVGVMGDERTYENVICLRAVTSTDGMTADWCHLPYNFLSNVSNEIINKVRGVNRVVYDISSKPPATIEWE